MNLSDSIYKEAWLKLAMCFGERMQDEELELMDAVLQSVKLDFEESKHKMTNREQRQASVERETKAYTDFASECLIPNPNGKIGWNSLDDAFREWLEKRGEKYCYTFDTFQIRKKVIRPLATAYRNSTFYGLEFNSKVITGKRY